MSLITLGVSSNNLRLATAGIGLKLAQAIAELANFAVIASSSRFTLKALVASLEAVPLASVAAIVGDSSQLAAHPKGSDANIDSESSRLAVMPRGSNATS